MTVGVILLILSMPCCLISIFNNFGFIDIGIYGLYWFLTGFSLYIISCVVRRSIP